MSISPVGELLREWRATQGVSQLDLALSSGVSSRHISFLETGRARPSRTMVLRLAETLDVPLRERNALLVAAGFAPIYRESDLDDEIVAPVRKALELILAKHDPYPAFVLDRAWNILLANDGHRRMLPMLMPDGAMTPDPVNVIRLCLHPELLRPRILDWEQVAHILGHRIRRQLRTPEPDPRVKALYDEIVTYPGVEEAMEETPPPPETEVLIPLSFDLEGQRLSWFSTIATIGTPQDVTLQELRIESLFPADEETERLITSV